ncbi:PrgI family mobile element protein [Bacillus sp. AFS040349]|uniref:PrgI family mobile element protein n=1 Tax=Bacillus sp. AFS040349 TaxID=2033502 RepID=UPI000BFE7AB0|nr:PrgI family protein [Bacillus sp. AFS040349]PGT80581.1 PrgI family protein [Bacillus sp. AFS040349]
MRKVTVPIDMSSEQKEILGIISKRQLIYLIVGGGLVYSYIPHVFNFAPNFFIGIFMCIFSALPVAIAVGLLGFAKKSKYHLHYDSYFLIKMGYKNQIGVWRKGPKIVKQKKRR